MSGQKKFKVLVTHPEVPSKGIDLLKEECDLIICENLPPQRYEILTKSKGVDAILWACHEKLNAEALDAAGPQLKVISTMSAGLDFVDIEEMKRRCFPIGHTPSVLNDAVADLTVGLMIAAARRFEEGRRKIVDSQWATNRHDWMLGQDIKGSTVGLIGLGGIGQTIVKRLAGFDVGRFLYTSRRENPKAKDLSAEYVTFDDLCRESDFIIVACPLTSETKGMINEAAFNKMKSNCVFVNIARGQIVDQDALYDALKNNKIFAAGLDVMTPEPLPKENLILNLPNCVIVPHLGSATRNTRQAMSALAAKNILEGLKGQPLIAPAY